MIELYSRDPRLAILMAEATSGVCGLGIHMPTQKELPRTFDYVATWGALNIGVERFAFRFQALPVVLPEGGEWLAEKARAKTVRVIGTDYRKVKM